MTAIMDSELPKEWHCWTPRHEHSFLFGHLRAPAVDKCTAQPREIKS